MGILQSIVRAARRNWRSALLVFLLALLLTGVFSLGALALFASNLNANTNRAGILVVFENGKVGQRCVEFSSPEITGIELLEQSGYEISVDASNALGVAVCKIGRDGCNYPGKPCFCECQGATCKYWSYWHWNGSEWIYANMGASSQTIRNGDVDGWVYGVGTTAGAEPPPNIAFEQVCAVAAATETPTNTTVPPTATSVPPTASSTALPVPPTETEIPTATDVPPTASSTALSVPPTETAAAPTNAPQQDVEPIPTVELIPTEPAPPTSAAVLQATNTPRPKGTNTRVPRTTTRAAVVSASSANATRAAQEAQMANEASSINPRVISIAALVGGIFVIGVGAVVLLGGAAWYFWGRGRF